MTLANQVQLPLISTPNDLCYPDGMPNARSIRHILYPGVSAEKMASLLDISASTYRSWEHGAKRPSGAAASLLRLAAVAPDLVRSVLSRGIGEEGDETHLFASQDAGAAQRKEFMAA